MFLSLDSAITQLQAEVDSFGQGTPSQPKDGTIAWYVLRAKSLGLSHLKRQRQLALNGDMAAAERHYRECQALLKVIDVPPAEEIEKETLAS